MDFFSPTDARATRRQTVNLHGNHEEADTRLILHSCERLVLKCSDTDVLLLLFYFMPTRVTEVWMVSGTSTQQKCYPAHRLSNQFSQSVSENLLSFHALTGCDTLSLFSGYGKKKCWKIFQRQPDSVSSIGCNGELDLIEQFLCRLYGVPTQTDVNQARLHLFVQGRKKLDMLPPTRDARDLQCKRANYQACIWLQADQEQIIVPHPQTHLPGQRKPVCYHLSGQDYPQFQKPVFN